MTTQKKDLGTISIVTKSSGEQVIEFTPSEAIDLTSIIESIMKITLEKDVIDENLADYFKELLSRTRLPLTIYQMANYHGVRSNIDNKTLIYWNYNTRSRYLNISPKADIALKSGVFTLLEIPKEKYWDEEGIENLSWDTHYFFIRDLEAFKSRLIEKLENQTPEISKYLIKYCKPRIQNGNFHRLQLSLDLDSWKAYEVEYKKELIYLERSNYTDDYSRNDEYTNLGDQIVYETYNGMYDNKLDYIWLNMSSPYLDINDVIHDLSTVSAIAIPVDGDTRFPQTLRVRLRTHEEINDFFDQLIPGIEDWDESYRKAPSSF